MNNESVHHCYLVVLSAGLHVVGREDYLHKVLFDYLLCGIYLGKVLFYPSPPAMSFFCSAVCCDAL